MSPAAAEPTHVRVLGRSTVHAHHPLAPGRPVPRCGVAKRGKSDRPALWTTAPVTCTLCRRFTVTPKEARAVLARVRADLTR